jgi:hypothetical protein
MTRHADPVFARVEELAMSRVAFSRLTWLHVPFDPRGVYCETGTTKRR